MMDEEIIQIEKDQNLLFCADDSKASYSNFYCP
jgi:hypothetical protein